MLSSSSIPRSEVIIDKNKITNTMRQFALNGMGYDYACNEYNYTVLVEATAIELDHDEWLDDPDHEIWEIAIEVAEWALKIRNK